MNYGFDLDKETLQAIVFLVAHDYGHCAIDKDGLSVYACVNDIFNYSTADSEEIPLCEVKQLVDEILKYHTDNWKNNPGWFPLLLWAQKKRGGMDFIEPLKKEIEEFLQENTVNI